MIKKLSVGLGILIAIYLLLWVGFGAAVGYFQPQDNGTAVVKTFDSAGTEFVTVLRPVNAENGQIWLLSGQWFRSWYIRALENPKVEIEIGGSSTVFHAVPVEDEEEMARVLKIRFDGVSKATRIIGRVLILFAPVKILRLEPAS